MIAALDTVLQIAAAGSVLLFLALAGLIGLMYLLTSHRLFGGPDSPGEELAEPVEAREPASEESAHEAAAEAERRRRAVVLAVTVAVAGAQIERAVRRTVDAPARRASEWRRIGRMRHLSKSPHRLRARA